MFFGSLPEQRPNCRVATECGAWALAAGDEGGADYVDQCGLQIMPSPARDSAGWATKPCHASTDPAGQVSCHNGCCH